MTDPTYAPPRPVAAPADPLAVALGNATLLGLGYLLLRRRRLTGIAVIGTVGLVDLTAKTADTWYEILLLLWWAAGIAHGWLLARRRPERVVRRGQRAGTLTLTLAVVLTASLLRIDAYGIENRVTEAREGGDCEAAVAAQGEVG
ncbi:hypothetical protein N4G67_41975, partial [Streptomyces violarus]|nr:hypothetical protein [Streptomyces violarus]